MHWHASISTAIFSPWMGHVQETEARALFSTWKCKKIEDPGILLEDEVGKMCRRLQHELDFRQKTHRNCRVWRYFGRWGREKVRETVAPARFHMSTTSSSSSSSHRIVKKNCRVWRYFGRWGREKVRETVIHFNSLMSIPSFQVILLNSFISIRSCQFIHFISFISFLILSH